MDKFKKKTDHKSKVSHHAAKHVEADTAEATKGKSADSMNESEVTRKSGESDTSKTEKIEKGLEIKNTHETEEQNKAKVTDGKEGTIEVAEKTERTDKSEETEKTEVTEETKVTEETEETEETDEEVQAGAGERSESREPEEGDMTESTARTIEVDEDEMLFTRRKIKNLETENKKLNNELEAFKERLLRITSEYENFRKRTAKEKEEIGTESTVGILRDILPVIDNLERALITETDDLPGLKDGVQMTLDQFVAAMKKMGVELIPTDEGFDPEYHEAVMHETDESKGPREVSEVFLKGYKKGEKVVRHAVVKVVN